MAARNAVTRGAISRGGLAPFYNPPSVAAAAAYGTQLNEYFVLRAQFAAGVTTAADDVTIYTTATAPFRFSVIRCWGIITANIAGTAQLRSTTGGGGTLYCQVITNNLGYVEQTVAVDTVTSSVLPGTRGLYIRRSDDRAAGEIFLIGMVMGA